MKYLRLVNNFKYIMNSRINRKCHRAYIQYGRWLAGRLEEKRWSETAMLTQLHNSVAWRPAASATRTIMGNNGTFSKANYERWRRCENQ